MREINIDHLIQNQDISRKILTQLSKNDLKKCACVSKLWRWAVKDTKSVKTINITVEFFSRLKRKRQELKKYLIDNYKYATDLDIIGWSRKNYIPSEVYDSLLKNSKVTVKSLTLRGRGQWSTCHCPKEKSNHGGLIGSNINKQELTNLEYLHIGQTFEISSCALIDLISRSPNLKVLKFDGLILNSDHGDKFIPKLFHCNIETIYWPWALRKHFPTIKTIAKRNENITTLYTNGETTCDLLASDALPNLKHLSLILNENWTCKPNQLKRANRHVEKTQYYSLAKKLEALELRTFDIIKMSEPEERENDQAKAIRDTNVKIDRLYEQYKVSFWNNIGKLKNLKYLAVYGSWEFDSVCVDISRNLLPIEYLRLHLMQNSIFLALEAGQENFVLSLTEGLKCLRKLVNLRSIQYTCYEKIVDIEPSTVIAFKDVFDKIWSLDIKTTYTNNVEDFLINLARRANQLGKTYKTLLNVHAKDDEIDSRFVIEQNLKFVGSNLKEKHLELADKEAIKRYRKPCGDIFLWGLEQVGNTRDSLTYEKLKSEWQFFEDIFNINSSFY